MARVVEVGHGKRYVLVSALAFTGEREFGRRIFISVGITDYDEHDEYDEDNGFT